MNTSTDLEARLAAALEARADAVTPGGLGPAAPPAAGPEHPRRCRGAVYAGIAAAAAAAVAAAVLVPVLLTTADDDGSPQPAPQPSPDRVEPSQRAGGPVRSRAEVDLDGDGTPDPVRLQVDPVAPGQRKEVVTAELSAGPVRELRATRMGRGASGGLAPGGDLDRDGDEELLLEWREGRARFAAPIDLEGGELRLLRFSSERTPLARGLLDGHAYGYAVSDDGALTSWRSVAVFVHDGPDDEVPPTFRADVFTWGIASQEGERVLRAEPAGRACVDGLAGAPRGCAARTPVPRSGPR